MALPKHALQYQTEPQGRWKVGAWILANVALIISICAIGVGVNRLLLPWDGFPEESLVRDHGLHSISARFT